jgi:hypothetical protein
LAAGVIESNSPTDQWFVKKNLKKVKKPARARARPRLVDFKIFPSKKLLKKQKRKNGKIQKNENKQGLIFIVPITIHPTSEQHAHKISTLDVLSAAKLSCMKIHNNERPRSAAGFFFSVENTFFMVLFQVLLVILNMFGTYTNIYMKSTTIFCVLYLC